MCVKIGKFYSSRTIVHKDVKKRTRKKKKFVGKIMNMRTLRQTTYSSRHQQYETHTIVAATLKLQGKIVAWVFPVIIPTHAAITVIETGHGWTVTKHGGLFNLFQQGR